MKSWYYQFVNFIQGLSNITYSMIWVAFLVVALVCLMKFFNSFDDEKKRYKKISFLIIAIVFIVLLIVFTYLRN